MSKRITRTQAAALVGVSDDTLARWEKKPSSDFPKPIAWVSNRRFYSEASVLAWLEARTAPKRARKALPAEAHA